MVETPTRPFSVLITDDDPSCRQAMREIIEPEGYRTLLAESAEEALDIARDQTVHVVLMDMHLPRLNGLDALRLLRQIRPQVASILVTADATAELMRQAFAAHAYSVIPKPVSKHVVLYTVVRAIVRVSGAPAPAGPVEPQGESREGRTAQ
jgi:CheY-like chemotaxis protein